MSEEKNIRVACFFCPVHVVAFWYCDTGNTVWTPPWQYRLSQLLLPDDLFCGAWVLIHQYPPGHSPISAGKV
jgi:hypothetical protein